MLEIGKQMVDVANDALGTAIGASVFVPASESVDLKTADMAKLMDSVRDQSLPPKFAAALNQWLIVSMTCTCLI